MDKQHFFISGMFRSGTTFMARALNAHPDLVVLSDPHREFFRFLRNKFFQEKYKDFNPKRPLSDYFLESGLDIDQFHEALFRIQLLKDDIQQIKQRVVKGAAEFSPLIANNIDKLIPGDAISVYNQLVDIGAEAYGFRAQKLIGTKEVWTDEFIGPLIHQGRKCIQIVRDPRAVIASNRVSITGAYPILFLIRQWRKSVAYYLKNRNSANHIMLRYEDIVTQPEDSFKKICGFLEISFAEEIIDPKKYKDGQGDLWRQNSSHGSSETINTNFMEKWRKVLFEEELKFIESFCRPEMNCLGYDLATKGNIPDDNELYEENYENIAPWITEFDFFLNQNHLINERKRLEYLTTNGFNASDLNLSITEEAKIELAQWA